MAASRVRAPAWIFVADRAITPVTGIAEQSRRQVAQAWPTSSWSLSVRCSLARESTTEADSNDSSDASRKIARAAMTSSFHFCQGIRGRPGHGNRLGSSPSNATRDQPKAPAVRSRG